MNLEQKTHTGDEDKHTESASSWRELESQQEEKDGSDCERARPEGGRAWVMLGACFVNYVLLSGYLKSLSLFYVALLRRFHTQAAETALLFSIRDGVFSVGKGTVMIGALLMSLSGILASLVDEMLPLICIQGSLFGLGHAMLIAPGEVLLGSWFHRRRALALALAKCGSSVGNMLMPPLLTLLLHHYGLSGALLLTGALALHCLPAAILFRPPQDGQAAGGKARAYSAHSHPGLAQDTQCMIQDGDSDEVGLMSSERSDRRDRPSAQTGRR